MLRPFLLSLPIVAILLSGCATPVAVESIRYAKVPVFVGDERITVRVLDTWSRKETTTWVQSGTVFVPVSSSLFEHLQFRPEQQVQFGRLLQSELERLKISPGGGSTALGPWLADLTFLKAERNSIPQTLYLQVKFSLGRVNQTPALSKVYDINSLEGLTTGEKWSIDGEETKARGVLLLLNQVLDDIQTELQRSKR